MENKRITIIINTKIMILLKKSKLHF